MTSRIFSLLFFILVGIGRSCTWENNNVAPKKVPEGQESPRQVLLKMMESIERNDMDAYRECYESPDCELDVIVVGFRQERMMFEFRSRILDIYSSEGIDYFGSHNEEARASIRYGWPTKHNRWWESVEFYSERYEAKCTPSHLDPLPIYMYREDGYWRIRPSYRPGQEAAVIRGGELMIELMKFGIKKADKSVPKEKLRAAMRQHLRELGKAQSS